ncbi:MAG: hypothetical protein ABI411_13660 [Tahibacter sp.]
MFINKSLFTLPLSALAFSLLSVSAFAQSDNSNKRTLDQVLTQDEGMTQVSEGLYASTAGATESYVAIGQAGHRSLLGLLIEIRSQNGAKKVEADSVPGTLDQMIDTLSAPQPKNQDVYGNCNGWNLTGPFFASAKAGGGIGGSPYGSSGLAVNNDGFSPPLNTLNYVSAMVSDRNGNTLANHDDTKHGTTAAVASAYAGGTGCEALSVARVTCPNQTNAAITAIAYNHRPGINCVLN